MAFITIAGVNYDIRSDSARQEAPVRIGGASRAFSGKLRNTWRAELREWTFTTPPYPQATIDTLRANTAAGANVAVTGDVMGGASVTCVVEVQESPVIMDGLGFKRSLTILVREVG